MDELLPTDGRPSRVSTRCPPLAPKKESGCKRLSMNELSIVASPFLLWRQRYTPKPASRAIKPAPAIGSSGLSVSASRKDGPSLAVVGGTGAACGAGAATGAVTVSETPEAGTVAGSAMAAEAGAAGTAEAASAIAGAGAGTEATLAGSEALAGVATVGAAGSAATEAAGAAGVAATGAAAGGVPMGNFTPVEVALPDAACRRASSLRFLFNSATRSDCS